MDKKIFELYTNLRSALSFHDVFKKVMCLLFLKKATTYAADLNFNKKETLICANEMMRKIDIAKNGGEPINVVDIQNFLTTIDDDLSAFGPKFSSLSTVYYELFANVSKQRDILNIMSSINLDDEDTIDMIVDGALETEHMVARKFYTHESILKLATRLLKLTNDDKLIDCYSGLSMFYSKNKCDLEYTGFEIDEQVAALSRINLLLRKKTKFEIKSKDFLKENIEIKANKIFADAILLNSDYNPELAKELSLETKENMALSILKIANHLEKDGTAVITVPAKVLFSRISSYCEMRKRLTMGPGLYAVIQLPNLAGSAFAMPSNILVIKEGYDGNVHFVDATSFTDDKRDTLLSDDDIEKIANAIENDLNEPGFSGMEQRLTVTCEGVWLCNKYIAQKEEHNFRSTKEIDKELKGLYKQLKELMKEGDN